MVPELLGVPTSFFASVAFTENWLKGQIRKDSRWETMGEDEISQLSPLTVFLLSVSPTLGLSEAYRTDMSPNKRSVQNHMSLTNMQDMPGTPWDIDSPHYSLPCFEL